MEVLLLRFDAPLVSFGAPIVDQHGATQAFPALSMLTGLLGNALGWEHRDHEKLQALQARIRYAARTDRRGERISDYQTVDLGQDYLIDENTAWTTWGRVEERGKGQATQGTWIRHREYWVDSLHTVALSLVPSSGSPTVAELQNALKYPARPLFIGRKCCLPSAPILAGVVDAPSPLAALCRWPCRGDPRGGESGTRQMPAWWSAEEEGEWVPRESRLVVVVDERDWRNQVHGGERWMRHGLIAPPNEREEERADVG